MMQDACERAFALIGQRGIRGGPYCKHELSAGRAIAVCDACFK
jgi:hypothetical protein